MRHELLRAVRIVVRADSDPARQALFRNLMGSHATVRLVFGLHEHLGGTWRSLLVSAYGAAAYLKIAPPANRRARVVAMAKHANARRQVARVAAWVGEGDYGRIRTGVPSALRVSGGLTGVMMLLGGNGVRRLLRILRRVDGRHGFLVACRVAAVIAWYSRTRALLARLRPGAVLVSSDSNPEEVGVTAAARSLGIPQVFIAHAYPTPFSPPLDFSLSILEGQAAVTARTSKGPVRGAIVLAGIEGESAPLDAGRFARPNPVIGIFTPKAISWPTLAAIIAECRERLQAREIVLRWHPSMLEPPRLHQAVPDASRVVESPRTAALADVARRCDWVVADENSNVHLPVLKMGIPTVAIHGLGLYPHTRSDLYGFGRGGIVFPPVRSLCEVRPDAFAAFFGAEWRARFEQYDATYLHPEAAVASHVRRAIWQLFEPAPSATGTYA